MSLSNHERPFIKLRSNVNKKGSPEGFSPLAIGESVDRVASGDLWRLAGVWGCPLVINTRAGGWVEMACALQAGITVNELGATNHVGEYNPLTRQPEGDRFSKVLFTRFS